MLRITFERLPLRTGSVGRAEISKVFGGCAAYAKPCEKDSDCCDSGLFACQAYDYYDVNGNRIGSGKVCLKPVR